MAESPPLRAHARRNRDKLLVAARAAFAADGDGASLEGIARAADVGIGTLYRHFPTREALVEAVYAAELDQITAAPAALLEAHPPDRALRLWMDQYAGFVAAKRAIMGTLRAGWASGRITPPTRERITAAIESMLRPAAEAGTLRGDVEADDVTAMLLGIFLSTTVSETPERTGRLLDLLFDALGG